MKNLSTFIIIFVLMPPICTYARNSVTTISNDPIDATQEVLQMESLTGGQSGQTFDPITQAVLTNFASIVGNFVTLLQDKDNTQHVGNNISSMLNSMVNIVVEVVKRGGLSLDDSEAISAYIQQLVHELEEPMTRIIAINRAKHKTSKRKSYIAERTHNRHHQ